MKGEIKKRPGAIPDLPSTPPPPAQKSNRELSIEAEIAQKKFARAKRDKAEQMLTDALMEYEQAAAETMRTDFQGGLNIGNFVKAMRVRVLEFKAGMNRE